MFNININFNIVFIFVLRLVEFQSILILINNIFDILFVPLISKKLIKSIFLSIYLRLNDL